MAGMATAQELQMLAESLRGVDARLKSVAPRIPDDSHLADVEEHETRVAIAFAEVSSARQMSAETYQEHKDVCLRAEVFARRMEHAIASARQDSPLPPSIGRVPDAQRVRTQQLKNVAESIGKVDPRAHVTLNSDQAEHEVATLRSKAALALPLLRRHDGLWRFMLPAAPVLLIGVVLILMGDLLTGALVMIASAAVVVLNQLLRLRLRNAERQVAQRVEKMVDSSKSAMSRAMETISIAENDVMAEDLSSEIVLKIDQWREVLPPKPAAVLSHLLKDASPLLLQDASDNLDPMQLLEWETLVEDTLPETINTYLQVADVSGGQAQWEAEQELLKNLLKIYDVATALTTQASAPGRD